MIKIGEMVLKGVIWVHIDKIRSNGIWYGKESSGYTMIKLG